MNKIKLYRKEIGLSQDKLAEIMDTKQSTISNWETGYRNPNVYQAIKLASVLCVTVEDLYK